MKRRQKASPDAPNCAHLINNLSSPNPLEKLIDLTSKYDNIILCAGWVKMDGVDLISESLRLAVERGANITVVSNEENTEQLCVEHCIPLTSMAVGVSAFAPTSLAQNFPSTEPMFETLRDAETIDNAIITALAQDARGLIWIGTPKGLIRYDGYHFRKFSHKLGDPFSLAGDYVFSLYAAPDGRLWVGTLNHGISVFDPTSERCEHFRYDEKVPDSLGGGKISALTSDGRGGMWIATEQGLDHLPVGTRPFAHFRHGTDPRSLMDNKVRSLLRDKAGRLRVGGGSGLQRLAPVRAPAWKYG